MAFTLTYNSDYFRTYYNNKAMTDPNQSTYSNGFFGKNIKRSVGDTNRKKYELDHNIKKYDQFYPKKTKYTKAAESMLDKDNYLIYKYPNFDELQDKISEYNVKNYDNQIMKDMDRFVKPFRKYKPTGKLEFWTGQLKNKAKKYVNKWAYIGQNQRNTTGSSLNNTMGSTSYGIDSETYSKIRKNRYSIYSNYANIGFTAYGKNTTLLEEKYNYMTSYVIRDDEEYDDIIEDSNNNHTNQTHTFETEVTNEDDLKTYTINKNSLSSDNDTKILFKSMKLNEDSYKINHMESLKISEESYKMNHMESLKINQKESYKINQKESLKINYDLE